jgi:hypothetical protein
MKIAPAFRGILAGLLSLASCSYSWSYDYRVTIAEDVVVDGTAKVIMVSSEGSDDIVDARADAEEDFDDPDREYAGGGATCCSPSATMHFFAYLDLDADETWDEDEPWGADPNNPVEIAEDGYVAEIVIESDPE